MCCQQQPIRGGGGGGGLKTKITKSVVSQQIFIWKDLSQKRKVGGGGRWSIHFLIALFKAYSKINVC